jgi:hypothetical protein
MQKFPKIISYLEQHREDVFALFDRLGMQGDLNPKRGGSITFLCPSAELAAEISGVIEGPNPENATDMLASLILTDLYTSPSSMTEGDVRTHLGRVLPVKRIGSQGVTLANGAVISPNIVPPFIPFERKGNAKRDNIAIWSYIGAMWDYESAPLADGGKTKKTAQTGGGPAKKQPNFVSGVKDGARKRLVKAVIVAAASYYASTTQLGVMKDGVNNPFIRASACILSNMRGDMPAMTRVMPFIFTPCRASTFFALLALVDDETIAGCSNWQNLRTPYDSNLIVSCMEEWMEFTQGEDPKPTLATREGQELFYHHLSRIIKDTPKSNLIHKKEMQVIDQLITSNKLGQLSGVLSRGAHESVRTNANLFKLVNFGNFELVGQLNEATGGKDPKQVMEILKEYDRYYLGTQETLAARIEGHESYDRMSNEFGNAGWQDIKRARFTQSLLCSLPMHRDVAARLAEKYAEEDHCVKIKAEAANITGAATTDLGLSSSTRNELREYMRARGGLPEEFVSKFQDKKQ